MALTIIGDEKKLNYEDNAAILSYIYVVVKIESSILPRQN
jgi:hypothetical protein